MITNLVATLHFVIVTNWTPLTVTEDYGYVRSNTVASFVFEGQVIQTIVKSDVLHSVTRRKQ